MHESFAPFGPLIYRADIRGEFNDFLLKHLDSIRDAEDARGILVGNIDQQRLAPYPVEEFTSYVDEHLLNYLKDRYERQLLIDRNIFNEDAEELNPEEHIVTYHMGAGPWVNFSHKGEFNPMHNHGGIFSAVVFIDIPDQLAEERKNNNFISKTSGCLDFISESQHIIVRPQTGTLYLFPAYLWHLVYPYHSDVERISMSFNIFNLHIGDFKLPHFSLPL